MRALVTGGSGFIGGHLVERLLSEGMDVKLLVRKTSKVDKLLKGDIELVYGDLKDVDSLREGVSGVDIVYHLAAAQKPNLPVEEYWNVNVLGIESLLRTCLEEGVLRVVYCSSVAVHGLPKNVPISEQYPFAPQTPYALSKCEAEKIALQFVEDHGMEITIVRPSRVYGSGDTYSGIFKLFQAIKKRRFFIIGSGENLMHTAYVKNVIDGILLAADKSIAIGQAYIFADAKPISVKEFVHMIANAENVELRSMHIPTWLAKMLGCVFDFTQKIGIEAQLSSRRVESLTANVTYDISKAEKDLGFHTKIGLKEGIQLTVEWYMKEGYL